jgi:hypothetical protein
MNDGPFETGAGTVIQLFTHIALAVLHRAQTGWPLHVDRDTARFGQRVRSTIISG